ncbi:ATP-dependent RNA helicase dbp4 [Schistosoma haematobium]|uniref:ATP-dependent RNA helicase dbp4 n=1 Tax=Schistosoma haematobium TaxID=6185 RepID=A0A922LER5_SCHHA|nr:ATP-dependent RNA helicase dbp4 [Schistosoma haematobium]KAH9581063.1 ATP-dependent RNA helicase dbp4 [Schistosoma haematobium]
MLHKCLVINLVLLLLLYRFPESKLQRRVSKESSSLLARKLELTQSARLAFTAYLRDYCLMARRNPTKQKQQQQQQSNELLNVFNAKDLPVEKFANSLGLPFISSLPKEYIQLVPDSVKLIKSFPSVVSNLSDGNVNQLSTTTATTDNVFSSMKMNLPHSTELIASNTDNNVDENDINMDSDDNLLIKKSSFNVMPNETKLKPLDLVQDTSTDDDTIEDDQHSRKSVNKLKKLSRIQLAKKELKQKIRSHRKLEFDDEGHVICEKIGDIPVAKPPIPIDNQIETTITSNETLNIDQERRLLHEIIDKEDKKLWRQRIRQRHQAERKKLKEERKKLSQSNGPKISLKENSSDSNIENESD